MSRLSLSIFLMTLILIPSQTLLGFEQSSAFAQASSSSGGQRTLSDSEIEFADQARIFKVAHERRKQLKEIEKEVDRRQKRLTKLEEEVIRRYKVLRRVQEELNSSLKRSRQDEDDGPIDESNSERREGRLKEVQRLSKTFNAMKPAQAAGVIEVMDEDLAVDVLKLVKPRQSGKILGALKPLVAARISEQMTKTRRSKRRQN
jgi:flagellar motility protein MotE (MotC chaperone)